MIQKPQNLLPNLYQCSTWSKSWIRDNRRIMLKILSSSFLIILQQKRVHLYMINLRYSVQLFFFRYLDFPSLIALSSSHPSLAWLWPDFYDFTVSRNMLKAKDAADVVLMNNFLADFPVEEVNSCNILFAESHLYSKCAQQNESFENRNLVTLSLGRWGWRWPGGTWGSDWGHSAPGFSTRWFTENPNTNAVLSIQKDPESKSLIWPILHL